MLKRAIFFISFIALFLILGGYKHIVIKPAIIDSLQWARGYHISPFGKIEVSWENTKNSLTLEVDIPENTSASVFIPATSEADFKKSTVEGGNQIQDVHGVSFIRMENGSAVLSVGSGHYTFVSNHK